MGISYELSQSIHKALNDAVLECFTNDAKSVTHYTSPNGFISILQKKEIWFGNINNVNDMTELEYARENVIIPCCKEFNFNSKKLKNNILRLLEKEELNSFSFSDCGHMLKTNPSIYVLSTSLSDNSNILWNMYTKNNERHGYSITFDREAIANSLSNRYVSEEENDAYGLLLEGKVEYDVEKQKCAVNKYLDILEYNLSRFHDSEKKQDFLNMFIEKLLILSLFIKDPDFAPENEYRFVIITKYDALPCGENAGYPYVFFTESNGGIASRLVVKFDKEIIKKVNISPYHQDDKNIQNVKHFLYLNGYEGVDIIQNKPKMR